MITAIKTYEGVPIGGTNFEDFLSYVRAFLGANFGFSTNVLDNEGGYFTSDNFAYASRPAVDPADSARFFVPAGQELGSLFGKKGIEYYRFEVLDADALEPQVHMWTLLSTDSESPDLDKLVFTNTTEENKKLPYRPLARNQDEEYLEGYLDIRFNGTPQVGGSDYSASFNTPTTFREQTLQFNRLRLGAEFPTPVLEGRYDETFLDPEFGISRASLESIYDSKLTFGFTNFSTEYGGHIVLWRKVGITNYFAYLQQDLGSAGPIPSGKYRVLDYSRGLVELNISTDQLNMLRHSGDGPDPVTDIPFVVVSAEQLLEDTSSGITSHISRYGSLYDGSSTDAILAEYIFDGSSNVVREIPNTSYSSAVGRVLLEDVNQSFTDGIILAFEYYGTPNVDVITEVQRNRYHPDTFQLYYRTGIVLPTASGTGNIRAFVESNPSSWYNRDILSAEYFPVNRTEETYYSLIDVSEEANFSNVFDPNQSFTIVDTIGFGDLNDVDFSSFDTGDVVYYDGTEFIGRAFTLENLLNVQSGALTNEVLQYNAAAPGTWTRRNVTQLLTQTVTGVAATISSPITYAPSVVPSSAQHLATKAYVDALAGGVGGDITTHANAVTTDPTNTLAGNPVHGATEYATAGRIIRRQANGQPNPGVADVTTPSSTITVASSENIVNINWIKQNSGGFSIIAARNNLLARYSSTGRLYATTPLGGDDGSTVATKAYVDGKVDEGTPTSDLLVLGYRNNTSDTVVTNLSYTNSPNLSSSSVQVTNIQLRNLGDGIGMYTFRLFLSNAQPAWTTIQMRPTRRINHAATDRIRAFYSNPMGSNGLNGFNSPGHLNNQRDAQVIWGGYDATSTKRYIYMGVSKLTGENMSFSCTLIAAFVGL